MSRQSQNMQKVIGDWSRATFPGANGYAKIRHLREEVEELAEGKPAEWPEEAADCAILLFALAEICGFDLLEEARKKHNINLGRTWEKSADGLTRHVEEPA